MEKEKENQKKATAETENGTKKNSAAKEKDADKEKVKDEKNTPADDKIKQYEDEIASLKDKYLRQAAEFDNYRKRVLKEKSELILNGGEHVLTSLLPVLDDFERALDNINKSDDKKTLTEGVELIYQKLLKALESNGLKAIDAVGADFDTDFHEAVAMIPAQKEEDKGKVVDCVQKGYKINDKVIRHAKVAVGQ